MLGQLDMVRHQAEVGFGLLLVMARAAVAPASTAADISLVPRMSAGVGIVFVVVFADLQFGEHLPLSLQP